MSTAENGVLSGRGTTPKRISVRLDPFRVAAVVGVPAARLRPVHLGGLSLGDVNGRLSVTSLPALSGVPGAGSSAAGRGEGGDSGGGGSDPAGQHEDTGRAVIDQDDDGGASDFLRGIDEGPCPDGPAGTLPHESSKRP